jgi:imidazolonepropionase
MRPLDGVVEGAAEIFTADGPPLADAVVGVHGGRVVHLGPAAELAGAGWAVGPQTVRHDATGGLVTPGLVECHTHLVFGGDRSREYGLRATGVPYLEISRAGGGIAATMRATRAASEEALLAGARARADRLIASGVTTVEIKSGYGLSYDAELKILRVARALGECHPVEVVSTFLGAHTVPPDRRADRQGYLDEVIDQMIPAVAAQGLAQFCDVFVEKGAFSVTEAERVFSAGLAHGLRPKVHADQLSAGGGAELAARMGAVSADHLEHISPEGIDQLAQAGTVAVLLPGAALFLGQDERPPARALLDAGVPVALSTDCNPGTCMTENLLLMLTLGMSRLGMSAAEVLTSVTRSAAAAIGAEDRAGVLALGRPADLAVFDVPSHHHLPYHFGASHTRHVLKAGEPIYPSPDPR